MCDKTADTRDGSLSYRQSYERYEQDVHTYGRFKREQDTASVLPGTTFEVTFFARGLPVHVEVSATRGLGDATGQLARIRMSEINPFDTLNPSVFDPGDTTTPPPPPDPTPVSSYQAAVTVRLFPPGGLAPFEWMFPEGTVDWFTRRLTFPEGRPDPALLGLTGWWRCTVTPTSDYPVLVSVQGTGRLDTVPVRSVDVSARLLNRVFVQALDAVSLRARMQDGALQVWISDEMAEILGRARSVFSYVLPSGVTSAPALEQLSVEIVSGEVCVARLDERLVEVERQIAHAQNEPERAKAAHARDALQAKRATVAARTHDVCIRIQAFFTDAPITTYFDIDAAEIDGDLGEIFLLFSADFTSLGAVVLLSIEYGTLASLADLVGLASLPRDVDETLERAFYTNQNDILGYFRAALGRLAARNGVALRAWWANNGIHLEYFVDTPRPTAQNTRSDTVTGPDTGTGSVEGFDASAGSAGPDPGPAPGPMDPLGEFPTGFDVVAGNALTRLDRTQTIVVIMMENRSFDHLLGDLPRARPRVGDRYDGIPEGASNASAGAFSDRVPMVRARAIGLDTRIPVSPNHHHCPVMFQIGGGTRETIGTGEMDGFARDLAHRTDAPQLAMTYYEEPDLPIYYRLADDQMVCDRWFCAHPGPTWPNRWITVCGTTPELENPENDDPRLGYMTERTVFDTLTEYGIEWKIFESDLSLIRLFDKYRIDDTNVLPRSDLEALLTRPGPLPRVMFIEPNFIDMPGGVANDDHPPADLADGQVFIGEILEAFRRHERWNEVTILITYDEHGGFYDHVPPPGSKHGDPAWAGRIPRVHPEGPEFLGVRVPTFVVSPYVAGPSISHVVFDHTSIIKTLLVHNRARLPRSAFGRFGVRVSQAAHLGQVLTEDVPRPPPVRSFLERVGGPSAPTPGAVSWIDPATDAELVFDTKNGAFVNPKTGWLVTPRTGAVLDPSTREPIAADVVLKYFPDRVRVEKAAPAIAVWADSTFKGLARDAATGRFVDEKTSYVVDAKTGAIHDPKTRAPLDPDRAIEVLGDRVRIETPSPLPTSVKPRLRPRVRPEPESRDFHQSLRGLFTPRRRYEQ